MIRYRIVSQPDEISEAELNKFGVKGYRLCKCYTYMKPSPYPIPVTEKGIPMPGPIEPMHYRDVLMHVYIFGKKDKHEPLN